MIKAIYIKDGESFTESEITNIPKIIEQKPKLLWVDICIEEQGLSAEEISILNENFKFHELSIEDCLFPQYHPKVEEFENYVFIAIHGVRTNIKDLLDFEKSFFELDMFIGKDFIVTAHPEETPITDSIYERAKLKPQVELKNLENLLYNIFQKMVVTFESIMEKISDRIDGIENEVLKNPSPELMDEIFSVKKTLLNLGKIIEPERNVYTYFTRETTGYISKKYTAYFREIFYQFDRMKQSIDSFNQVIGSILEVYLSGVTVKLNEVMKFLTILATLALPAVIVASYYGMNVAFLENKIFGQHGTWYFALFLIVVSTIGIFIYLKKKKWF